MYNDHGRHHRSTTIWDLRRGLKWNDLARGFEVADAIIGTSSVPVAPWVGGLNTLANILSPTVQGLKFIDPNPSVRPDYHSAHNAHNSGYRCSANYNPTYFLTMCTLVTSALSNQSLI